MLSEIEKALVGWFRVFVRCYREMAVIGVSRLEIM